MSHQNISLMNFSSPTESKYSWGLILQHNTILEHVQTVIKHRIDRTRVAKVSSENINVAAGAVNGR